MTITHPFRSVDWAQGAIHQEEPARSANGILRTQRMRHADGTTVLVVAGEVDGASQAHLEQELRDCVDAGPPVLLVDMFEVTFFAIGSAKIIAAVLRQAGACGVSVRFVNLQPMVIQTLGETVDLS